MLPYKIVRVDAGNKIQVVDLLALEVAHFVQSDPAFDDVVEHLPSNPATWEGLGRLLCPEGVVFLALSECGARAV